MSLLMNLAGGFVLGVIVFFLAPLVVSGFSQAWGDELADRYRGMAMGLVGRALLVKRKHGGYWFKASSFDAKHAKEKTKIGGETKHFEDPENLMSRLYGWPFAIAHEKSETIIDPRFSEVGEFLRDRARKGDLFYEHGGETFINGFARVADSTKQLVNPDHAVSLVAGDANPGTTDWAVEVTKQSLSPFQDASMMDYITGFIVLAGTWGLCWMAYEVLGGSGGGGSRTVGIGASILVGVPV